MNDASPEILTGLSPEHIAELRAARETLENLIASVAIMLERPFIVGDSVVLDKISGDIDLLKVINGEPQL